MSLCLCLPATCKICRTTTSKRSFDALESVDRSGNRHDAGTRERRWEPQICLIGLNPSKSVSIAALVCNDARIVEAHERTVECALEQLEPLASTRMRKNHQCTDRHTGKFVTAL